MKKAAVEPFLKRIFTAVFFCFEWINFNFIRKSNAG
jgi:hypothetical protein